MSKKVVLYARSATGENDALARQLEACREWVQANGYIVVGEYSEVASGMATVLPEQAKAIAQAQRNEAALVCTEASRLTRNLNAYTQCVAGCKWRGVTVFFVNEGAVLAENGLNRVWWLSQNCLVKTRRIRRRLVDEQ